jgi:hypothetical protein
MNTGVLGLLSFASICFNEALLMYGAEPLMLHAWAVCDGQPIAFGEHLPFRGTTASSGPLLYLGVLWRARVQLHAASHCHLVFWRRFQGLLARLHIASGGY